jgi:NADP-dependent 3-hydroxy acid dehydrogenase YdfG
MASRRAVSKVNLIKMLIKGTCSIVTGGSSGIGKALANLLVQKG